jgi:hypothetical protein
MSSRVARLGASPFQGVRKVPLGPAQDEGGQQTGVVGGELLSDGEFHRGEGIGLAEMEAAPH